MDNATKKYSSFAIFSGIRKGSTLLSQTLIGTAFHTSTEGLYRVVLERPYKKVYYMAQNYFDKVTYSVFCPGAEDLEASLKPCGDAKLDPEFQSYLELNVKGYPPLFMELFPMQEAA